MNAQVKREKKKQYYHLFIVRERGEEGGGS